MDNSQWLLLTRTAANQTLGLISQLGPVIYSLGSGELHPGESWAWLFSSCDGDSQAHGDQRAEHPLLISDLVQGEYSYHHESFAREILDECCNKFKY